MTYQNSDDRATLLGGETSPQPRRSSIVPRIGIALIIGSVVMMAAMYVAPTMGNVSLNTIFGQASEIDPAAVLLGAKSEDAKKTMFFDFKIKHGKKYSSLDQEMEKYEVFKSNLHKIDAMNGKGKARYAITKFSDMTEEEFTSINGLRFKETVDHVKSLHAASPEDQAASGFTPFEEIQDELLEGVKASDSVDWRGTAVTSVKDQGMCGDCWAFAACGDMEGTWALTTGQLVDLSEQYLTDCDSSDDGCSGGMMSSAYEWVIKNGGMQTLSEYPFTSGESGKEGVCKVQGLSSDNPTVTGWTMVTGGAANIKAMLASKGPISVAVNAVQMQFYDSGVDEANYCLWGELNHGVLLVGYGSENGQDYWIIKNSWGTSWGEKGYYRISMDNGACGVEEMPMKSL
eukprot:CAMPEP_0194576038 /NCGR_PEP_ID=MMETSP0292-20121207/11296_1 /TAXON_ID=39354 /ORGANISM="Heterosigma akashiwo, Strain CCMP2393" /LENGTH=400 /DNA_ID=CAMNT_0039427973 /DNA_START=71 /DNA_END=1273 /DNA_ORIENTATION=-